MLVFANVLEAEECIIGSEIGINHQQNRQNVQYTLYYKNSIYKNIEAQKFRNSERPCCCSLSCFCEWRRLWPKGAVDQISSQAV